MSDQVRGKPVVGVDYEHPRWSDGTPMLIDDEVQDDEGYRGFVSGVPNSEEVAVCWYVEGDDVSDPIEHAPEDLIRVDDSAPEQPCPDCGDWGFVEYDANPGGERRMTDADCPRGCPDYRSKDQPLSDVDPTQE